MTQLGDLEKVERKAYRSTYQDGLYDICFGILLAAWAVLPFLTDAGIPRYLSIPPFLIIPAIILFVGKKYITVPRYGAARFSPRLMTRAVRLMGAGAIGLLVTYILVIVLTVWGLQGLGAKTTGDLTIPLVEAVAIFVALVILAYYSEFQRLYLYAVFFAGGIPLAETLYHYVGEPTDALIAFGVPALIVLVTGIVLFARFLGRYPPPNSEAADGI